MAPRGGGILHGEQTTASMHGGRRLFGSSNGRMEGPYGLEDRMRYATCTMVVLVVLVVYQYIGCFSL